MLWLAICVALFSDMARLHPRYTEALAPAVAGSLGVGVAWATERSTRWRLVALTATLLVVTIYAESLLFGAPAIWWATAAGGAGALALAWAGLAARTSRSAADTGADPGANPGAAPASLHPPADTGSPGDPRAAATLALALLCLLAIPLWSSLRGVHENVSDTNRLGVLHAGELLPLSAYLRAHQGSAYYEAAFDSGTKMGELVVRDARPILVLSTLNGRVFTPVARLRALATAGRVRYAFTSGSCGPRSTSANADCTAPARWVQAHGVDVSVQAGLPRRGILWRLP